MKNYVTLFITIILSFTINSQEICDNAIDDDLDGFIDLLDSECLCGQYLVSPEINNILPNPSFELNSGCPFIYSQDELINGWWPNITDGSTDYLNLCDFTYGITSSSPLYNFPDGEGVCGTYITEGYYEYFGCELNSDIITGTPYTFEFYIGAASHVEVEDEYTIFDSLLQLAPYINLTIYGSNDTLEPFDPWVQSYDCMESLPQWDYDWDVIGSVYYVPVEEWNKISFTFIPEKTYRSVIIGGPCVLAPEFPYIFAPDRYSLPYFVWDGLAIDKSQNFNSHIERSGALCTNDLTLLANFENDTISIDYQWYLEGISLLGETNPTLNASLYGDGIYSVVYTYLGVCETRTITIEGSLDDPMPSFTIDPGAFCSGITDTIIVNGNADFYNWSPSDPLYIPNDGSSVLCTLDTNTTFQITGYLNGCPYDTTFEITVYTSPVIGEMLETDTSCLGGEYLLELNLLNTQYLTWSVPELPNQTPPHVFGVNDSTYILTPPYNELYTITAYNYMCTDEVTFFLNINSWILPDADGTASTHLGLAPLNVNFQNFSQYPWLPITYLWDFGNGETITTAYPSIVSTLYSVPGIYYVTLTADDDGVCSSIWYDTIIVLPQEQVIVSIPNVFSPNGDKINDEFFIDMEYLNTFSMKILNRWGEIVTELSEYNNSWDGKFNGRESSEGTYYYYFSGKSVFEQDIVLHGLINLEK